MGLVPVFDEEKSLLCQIDIPLMFMCFFVIAVIPFLMSLCYAVLIHGEEKRKKNIVCEKLSSILLAAELYPEFL